MNSTTTDDDLGEAFAAHADEALEISHAWICGPDLPTYGWGESVTADRNGVTVHLNRGYKWVADLELDLEQARMLGEQLLDIARLEES